MSSLPRSEGAVEREKVRKELERANELVAQLRNEIRVLESRRDEIRQGIEAESVSLRRQRELELDDLTAQAEAAIEPLKAERKAINEDIASLTRKKLQLETDVVGLDGQIAAERDTLGMVVREVATAKKNKETAEASATATTAQIANLQANIRPLQEELANTTTDLRTVATRLEDTDKELVALQAKYQIIRSNLTLEIAGLERKRNDLATALTAENNSLEQTREQLTKWQETLTKQDKIIRAREYKVAAAEQKIADNVGLLNL